MHSTNPIQIKMKMKRNESYFDLIKEQKLKEGVEHRLNREFISLMLEKYKPYIDIIQLDVSNQGKINLIAV